MTPRLQVVPCSILTSGSVSFCLQLVPCSIPTSGLVFQFAEIAYHWFTA